MSYDFYIDVFFFMNAVMDILILVVLSKMMKLHTTAGKVIISGMVGALWACILVLCPIMPRVIESILTFTLISGLMVKITFSPKDVRELCHQTVGFFISAVLLGGIIVALLQYTRAGYYIEQLISGNLIQSIPMFIILLLAAGSGLFCVYIWHMITAWYRHKRNLYQVTLYYQGNSVKTLGLLDTGNRLYEPTTHKPVSVITASLGLRLCQRVSNVCYIPYQSVGTKSGMLPAIYLDQMEISQDGDIKKIIKPLVAIYNQALSPSDEYEMLLHEEMV